ncbi:MAG: hypothetical protein ACHQNU_08110 [Actinomycetota bacterium]
MTPGERTQAGREPDEAVAESIRNLAGRIEALQADVRRLGSTSLPAVEPGWADDPSRTPPAVSYAWLSALETPVRRRPTVPRLLLETLFLAATAAAAAIAELDALVIAAVMAGAWVLVALIEWAASRADRRRDQIPLMPAPAPPEPVPADAAWFVPPVEHTLLEAPAESPTAITKLPPPQEHDAAAERSPGP